MRKLLWSFVKQHFYGFALGFSALFFALTLAQQSGPKLDEEKLLADVTSWHANADELKKYLISPDFKVDSKTKRFDKYNEFSNRNNALMQSTFQSTLTKKYPSVHNTLAKSSISFANYFEAVKKVVHANPSGAIPLLPENPLENVKTTLGSQSVNLRLVFSILGTLFLSLSFLHLFLIFRKEQKQNATLDSQVDTFKKVISNMTEGVIVTDKYGLFTFCNESAKNIIGLHVNDIVYESSIDGMGFHSLDGRKLPKEELPMHTALKKGLVTDQEVLVKNSRHPEGVFVSCSSGFFVDSRGVTAGSVVVLKNITAKKQLEEFWKDEKERAIENSKLKSDFLASMSHEIRTPMNAVLGLTTLLKETKLNTDQKDYVLTIQRSAKALLTLINDILDHSKIEAGKLDIINAPFNVKILAKDIADNFKPLVMEKNIELKLDFSLLKHDYFNSDNNRIRQIMINLIGNAIKFTKVGYVELKFETINEDTTTNKVKFTIKDTGSGMTQLEVSHLFQKYFQTKDGQNVGGTGLGLSICKQLVDLLKGEIGVDSEQGKGTQFWFTLPLQTAASIANENSEQDSDSQLFTNQFNGLILIAEDSTVNQKVITNYLGKLGLKTIVANNGQEAVEMYQEHHPDLILMDSNMPVMSGLEATKKIVELQTQKQLKKTPIVGLSADVRQSNFDENLKAGMSSFLTKPVELRKLVTELKKHFTASKQVETVTVNTKANGTSQLEKIQHLMVGDQLLMEVLLQDFTAQAPAQLGKMPELLQAKSFTELYQTAHALKSAAAELDASDLRQALQKIEALADADANTNADAELKMEELKQEIAKATSDYPSAVAKIEQKISEIKKQRQAS